MILSGSDILVRTLIDQGVDIVFGYPGGQVINIYDSLYKYQDELKHVLTAHEQGAAHAADGYARASGKPGVVIATSGPGATNLVTGIATAYLDSVPMIAITGNVATSQIGTDSFQEIDITGITLPITKHNFFVTSIDELQDTILEAFRLAVSGRPGPVLIDIPKDVQIAMCEYTPKAPLSPYEKCAAKDVRIEEAAKCINESERPFIYFGGGMISSDAVDEMLELSKLINAPMGCSLMGLSAVPSTRYNFLGMQGMHGCYYCTMAMNKADCIIALGVRFNDRSTGNREKFAKNAKVIHIDIDGAELSKTVNETHSLRGDLKLTLQRLLPMIKKNPHEEWGDTVKDIMGESLKYVDNRNTFNPKTALNLLSFRVGSNFPIVTDVGQHQMWAAHYMLFEKARRFISSGGLGTMGFGMGAAIGAYFATGETTILITGDGGFGMSLTELATAVTNNIPLVIILMNNGVLGMVRQWQTLFFDKHYSGTVLDRKTDFVKLAEAFGAKGKRVTELKALDAAITEAFSCKSPYVIECMIDKDEFVLPMLPPGGSIDDIIVKRGD